ncbi:restriction endonuclease [Streptomyces sp. NPDC126503]|uniref:restriction endonuclease n=1 Tax=Streptomyces sp. NPDC126503 TaxID=3155315 RepID=UPI0033169F51
MTTAHDNRGAPRRGSAAMARDVVLAVGLVGICGGGLALFLRTADVAGARGTGWGLPLAIVAVLLVGVVMARWSVAPSRRRPLRAGPPAPPADLPEVGADALDHAEADPDGFEHTVAALCVRDGCATVEVVGGAGDLGADVVATTADGRRVVLQCKHYAEDHRVGSQDLQRFGGTCFTVHEADVAVLVTTSSFTAPALDYAATCGIVCVDGDALAAWTESSAPPPWETYARTGADAAGDPEADPR